MPNYSVFTISKDGKRQKMTTCQKYGAAIELAQTYYGEGARGAWVESADADEPVVKFKIGETA